jgi:DNA replication protein DnaC
MFLSKEEREKYRKRLRGDLVLHCPKCNGTGFISKTDEKGFVTSTHWSCTKEVEAKLKLLDAGITYESIRNWNMDKIQGKHYFKKIQDYIINFNDNYSMGKGLFIHGRQGIGKTTVSCIIAEEISKIKPYFEQNEYSVGFIMFADVVDSTFDEQRKRQVENFLMNVDLLIIDNLGNEAGRKSESQFTQRILEMTLRKRHNKLLPTVITTNYELNEIEKMYNKDIHDFLIQNNEEIFFSDENHRTTIEEKNDDVDDLKF